MRVFGKSNSGDGTIPSKVVVGTRDCSCRGSVSLCVGFAFQIGDDSNIHMVLYRVERPCDGDERYLATTYYYIHKY